MQHKYHNEIEDIKPKSWLSKYRKTSVSYLVEMAFFYYAMGVVLQIGTNYIAEQAISGYVGPSLPYSISIGLTSGPVEDRKSVV